METATRKQIHIMAYYILNTILNDDIQAIITDIISDVISHCTSLVSLSDEYKEKNVGVGHEARENLGCFFTVCKRNPEAPQRSKNTS